ncbi:hypothetical protein [Belnapia sp. F-4-1]|uniref:hypothetical protein n=1 Tax=Belnapia sp. F-4-1 TaxID=1545443 RepID=UPI0005B8D86B|nr:hypothetical protein [Belnapia sp. F-4-1]
MRDAWSILLQQFVQADNVGYSDCRAAQIICPVCHEALHKRGEIGSARQHLAHYPSSNGDPSECERRVAGLSRQQVAEVQAEARGQQLAIFQRPFQRFAVQYYCQDERRNWPDLVRGMLETEPFRIFVRDVRNVGESHVN